MRGSILPCLASCILIGLSLAGCLGLGDDPGENTAKGNPVETEAPEPAVYNAGGCCLYHFSGPYPHADEWQWPYGHETKFPWAQENVSGYAVELSWEPGYPTNDELALWVVEKGWTSKSFPPDNLFDEYTPEVAVEGSSPLRIAFPVDGDMDATDYAVMVRSAGDSVGITYHQEFELDFAAFLDMPFEQDWSDF